MTQATEDAEQICLFRWASYSAAAHPELRLLFHIPNEGKRGPATAARFKEMGLKAGVPDVCLPVARGGYHGLYIEMKRKEHGRATDHQRAWLHSLTEQGYRAVICCGWEAAAEEIKNYLKG